jgi:hypothetical protein
LCNTLQSSEIPTSHPQRNKALGLTVPATLLATADEVIE